MKKIFLLLLLAIPLMAQQNKLQLTGVTSYDIKQAANMDLPKSPIITLDESPQKKSVFLAGAFSAIVPGSGQFYNGDYIKSALFAGIEVAAIIVGLSNNKKGDDQTNFFQDYANQHWSAERYANWTVAHAKAINPDVNSALLAVYTNGRLDWGKLNTLETAIGQGTNYYSHRLAYFGDQQYYEMIGKYPQFNVGWDDFGDINTPFQYGDPVTANFHYYSGERGKANDYYNIASKAVIVVLVNHLASLIDAVWSAASFNKSLQMNVSMQKEQVGYRIDYSTMLNFKYNF